MQLYYTGIVALSSAALIFMNFGVRSNLFLPRDIIRKFQILFGSVIAANVAEWLAFMLDGGAPSLRGLHIAAKFMEMFFAPVIPFVCAKMLGKEKLYRAMISIVHLNVLLQVISLFTGWVFRVDEANLYTRGVLYPLYCLLFFAEGALLFVRCVQFSRTYQNQYGGFLVCINLLVLSAMLLPLVVSGLRLDWTCISFAAVLYYIYYNQLVQQTDGMTKLLSRLSFEAALNTLDREATMFFMDVDGFKRMNDVYGHAYGDECLTRIAQAMKATFENTGLCYRYGGDEFCVISYKPLPEPEKFIRKLENNLGAIRKEDEKFPWVSVGFARFDPEKETPRETVSRADFRMYEEKRHE